MEKKLYIGSLPYSTTPEELQKFIEEKTGVALPVERIAIISDKFTGQSKGFGFADFSDEGDTKFVESAEALEKLAAEKLHGQEMGGRTLVANLARPKEDRPRTGGNSYGGGDRGGFGGGNGGGGYRGGNSRGGNDRSSYRSSY